jgi:hypothetical protein
MAEFNLTTCYGRTQVYGSNDGAKWTVIHDQSATAISYTNLEATVSVTRMEVFSYFGLVVSELGGGEYVLNFNKWKLMGSNALVRVLVSTWLCCQIKAQTVCQKIFD